MSADQATGKWSLIADELILVNNRWY